MTLTYTFWTVLAGAALLGALGGALGAFAFLRRQSLLSDALAHAALPGVCLAFLLTGAKAPLALLLGALATGLVGALAVVAIARGSRIKDDAAIAIVLSVFFGVGIVLLTYAQRHPGGHQSGLNRYLFGQAASLVADDLVAMALLGGAVALVLGAFFKEFGLATFDRDFAASVGYPVRALEILLTTLVVAVVMVGLQMVGVVLIIATLVTPAAAARQWTDRLVAMVPLSAAFGAVAGATGAVASAAVPRLPTGPAIVLVGTTILAASLLAAPRRGLVRALVDRVRLGLRIRRENLLKDLHRWGEEAGRAAHDREGWVPRATLIGWRVAAPGVYERTAAGLAAEGLVEARGDALRLTPSGRAAAERIVRKHRLWESYLARRLDLPADHVHRDAEAMEHALSDAAVDRLDDLLGRPAVDPHGRPIPRPSPGGG